MSSPIRRGVVDSGPLHCLGGWPPPPLALTHFHPSVIINNSSATQSGEGKLACIAWSLENF